jgi:hypothetical protein
MAGGCDDDETDGAIVKGRFDVGASRTAGVGARVGAEPADEGPVLSGEEGGGAGRFA